MANLSCSSLDYACRLFRHSALCGLSRELKHNSIKLFPFPTRVMIHEYLDHNNHWFGYHWYIYDNHCKLDLKLHRFQNDISKQSSFTCKGDTFDKTFNKVTQRTYLQKVSPLSTYKWFLPKFSSSIISSIWTKTLK